MFINLEQLLNLNAIQGVGPTRLRSLVARFRSTEKIFKASFKELTSVDGVDDKTAKNILQYSNFNYGSEQLKRANERGIEIISFWDERYPENLKRIYDPPVLLYVKGSLEKEDKFAISIVGMRMPSDYGRLIAEKLSKQLSSKGMVVVSGMARGIDTISHRAAVQCNGRTIAVLGSGLDRIYPPENGKLAEEITKKGALVSEFELGTAPDAVNFPRRNRIISGLSLGTVVVEAGVKSGALLTANYSLEQNREVFAVPGNINSMKSAGTNQLIKMGAKLVISVEDILIELQPQLKHFLKAEKEKDNYQDIDKNLSEVEKTILKQLSNEPIHIDKLAPLVKKTTGETLSVLLPLEFKGLVKQLPGKLFIRV